MLASSFSFRPFSTKAACCWSFFVTQHILIRQSLAQPPIMPSDILPSYEAWTTTESNVSSPALVKWETLLLDEGGWVMEGSGRLEDKREGTMTMYSPDERGNHVLWAPWELTSGNFLASWQMTNLHPSMGLCVVFFEAKGVKGEDLFDSSLRNRNGDSYIRYIFGDIRSYSLSYYANAAEAPDRQTTNLRKSPAEFPLRDDFPEGIPTGSTNTHRITLRKEGRRIQLWVDERQVVDYEDDNRLRKPYYYGGKIGFRQMKWSKFSYANLAVWEFDPDPETRVRIQQEQASSAVTARMATAARVVIQLATLFHIVSRCF